MADEDTQDTRQQAVEAAEALKRTTGRTRESEGRKRGDGRIGAAQEKTRKKYIYAECQL